MKPNYKPPKISSGDLRIPVTFFRQVVNDGPEPGTSEEQVYFCLCEPYESSIKDIESIGKTHNQETITINIRNPHSDYLVKHSDKFRIVHYLYHGVDFNVSHVALNSNNKEFIKIVGVHNVD